MNPSYGSGPARASTDISVYAASSAQVHKQSMNDNAFQQHQVTKDNLLGNMLASHNQQSLSLNTSVNPARAAPGMSNAQLNASTSSAAGVHGVTSTKNTIKSPKTNIQGIPISKHGAQLAYQPPRPHSQNKDSVPKNSRIAQHDPGQPNPDQAEMNYKINAQRLLERATDAGVYEQAQQMKRGDKNRAGPGRNSDGPPGRNRNYKPNRTHQTH